MKITAVVGKLNEVMALHGDLDVEAQVIVDNNGVLNSSEALVTKVAVSNEPGEPKKVLILGE